MGKELSRCPAWRLLSANTGGFCFLSKKLHASLELSNACRNSPAKKGILELQQIRLLLTRLLAIITPY